ncbi:MAG TPA: uroporphyrinogen-III C-methyltransferase, partial [Candidatus Binataceae bacterium]
MKPRHIVAKPASRAVTDDEGRVFLVGAGPGSPDLITMRGADVMRRADVVVYDALVSPEVLRLAPASAERIFAGKKGGEERSTDQSEINRILIEHARAGRRVVRLKGGDPFIFGRGGEEAEALAAAGIAFEVVPGVTSAIAAPAFAGIPLTHRDRGSFVTFVTGHQDSARDSADAIPWDDLARSTARRGTLVILMATARMRTHLARLIAGGLGAETPAAAIEWGSTASQKTIVATLGTLAHEAASAGLKAPAVIVVGECAALGRDLNWFEAMPLF